MATRAAIGLGSNLGDRLAALQGAVDALAAAPDVRLVAVSGIFETAPVGGPEQDDFLNAVALVETSREPLELLDLCQSIEETWARTRDIRWGPRTLDVDILAIDEIRSDDPRLTLPHPRAHERAFVCVPWASVDPDASIAGRGRVVQILVDLDTDGVRERPDLRLGSDEGPTA